MSGNDYVTLLDWFDKVRLGLWLGYRYLQRDATFIEPNFTIGTRPTKDRLLAVYAGGDNQVGLNTWGTETPLFQFKPSAFALRVNNTLFLNASWDWMCSSRCGFPFPRTRELLLDSNGLLKVGSFRARRRIVHPLITGLAKPCVLVAQPVLQQDVTSDPVGIVSDDIDYCLGLLWPGREDCAGPLLRQFKTGSVRIAADEPVEFDEVSLQEAKSMLDLRILAYRLQIESIEAERPVSTSMDRLRNYTETIKACVQFNKAAISHIRGASRGVASNRSI